MTHAKIIQNVIAGGRLLFRCSKAERQGVAPALVGQGLG